MRTAGLRNRASGRHDRMIREMIHDPYKTRRKLPEPTVCPVCKAVFRGGRWQWADAWPADACRETCQACHRIRDNYPAGMVTLEGAFVRTHKEEILQLVRNHERGEKTLHPLHRIMGIEQNGDRMVITTTDIHLPRRLADALRRAYKGDLDVRYDEEGYFVRVNWKREDHS